MQFNCYCPQYSGIDLKIFVLYDYAALLLFMVNRNFSTFCLKNDHTPVFLISLANVECGMIASVCRKSSDYTKLN